jgi:hypothetical protein
MTNEEYQMYQKAVNYILGNLDNPDFTTILRQNGYKIIPCKLSFVIENLEKAGYTVTKNEPTVLPVVSQPANIEFNKEELLSYIKSHTLSVYALIKETTILLKENSIDIIFGKDAFFKYKQCSEENNKVLLTKLISEFFNKQYIIQIAIDK